MLKLLTTIALSASCLLAQQVRAFDKVQENNGIYSLEISGWIINPGAFDISQWDNDDVEVTGTLATVGAQTEITLQSIALAADLFDVDGAETLGSTLTLTLESPTATYCFVLGGVGGDPAPLDPFNHPLYTGTSYLQQPGILVSSGLLTNGIFTDSLPIPNNPALVGASLRVQGGMVNGQFMLINAHDIGPVQ